MLGLVHPCKVYNILAVGAPVLYIGPKTSHVTEILNRLGEGYPWASCPHGDTDDATDQIVGLMDRARNGARQVPAEVASAFSKGVLLPSLIAVLEELRHE